MTNREFVELYQNLHIWSPHAIGIFYTIIYKRDRWGMESRGPAHAVIAVTAKFWRQVNPLAENWRHARPRA
jgi:hypothetical protein